MPATRPRRAVGHPASRHEAACASGSVADPGRAWPICGPAHYGTRAGASASSWRRPCPATPPPSTSARPPGWARGRGRRGSCGRTCSPESPTSTTGATASTTTHLRAIAAAELRQRPRATPTRRPATGRCPTSAAAADRRRRGQPGRRGPAAPLRLQPDDRRRRGRRPRHRRLAARPPGRAGRSAASTAGGTAPSGWACSRSSTAPPTTRTCCPTCGGAVLDAFDRAHVTLDDVDGFEVHDCFTPSEYLAIDHIGLTGPGESWKAIENGEIEIGGRAADQPQRRAHRRRPPRRRVRRADARSTPPSRSAARPATIRSRAQRRSAR